MFSIFELVLYLYKEYLFFLKSISQYTIVTLSEQNTSNKFTLKIISQLVICGKRLTNSPETQWQYFRFTKLEFKYLLLKQSRVNPILIYKVLSR